MIDDYDITAKISDVWYQVIVDNLNALGFEDRCDKKFMHFSFDEITNMHNVTCGISVSYTESIKIPKEVIDKADAKCIDNILQEIARLLMARIYHLPVERNYIIINGIKYIKETL